MKRFSSGALPAGGLSVTGTRPLRLFGGQQFTNRVIQGPGGCDGGFRLGGVGVAGRIRVAEDGGVFGEMGRLVQKRRQGRRKQGALFPQFRKVMGLAKRHIMKCEKGLFGLLGALLAMEDGRRGFFAHQQQGSMKISGR